MSPTSEERFLTTAEAASRLGLSESRTRQLAAAQLGGERIGGRWRIPASAVEAFANQRSLDSTSNDSSLLDVEPATPHPSAATVGFWESHGPKVIRRKAREKRFRAESRAWAETRDPKENEETSPPEGERLLVRSVWIVEAYTPATSSNLTDGFAALGWDSKSAVSRNAAEWVRNARSRPSGGAWMNLGWIVRPSSWNLLDSRVAELPPEVEAASGGLFSIGPGVTLLVVGFLIADEAAGGPDDALRHYYTSFDTKLPKPRRGWSTSTPENQKRDAFFGEIEALRTTCSNWVRNWLPGTFALNTQPHPGLVVLTTDEHKPFEPVSQGVRDWTRVTRLDVDMDAWESEEMPGWRLGTRWTSWDDDHEVLVLAARASDSAGAADLNHYGPETDPRRIDYWISMIIPGTVARWGLICLIERYHSALGQVRDVSHPARAGAVKALERLRTGLVGTAMDAKLAAVDIEHFAATDHLFHCDAVEWENPCATWRRDRNENSLLEHWRLTVQWQLDRLARSQQEVASLLIAEATLVSGISNLRVQRAVQWLTAVILVLTAAAVLFAKLALDAAR